MVTYPAQLDTTVSLPTVTDDITPITGSKFNLLRDAILVIEQELGVKAKSVYSSTAERITNLETTVGNLQIISLANDLGGTLNAPKVIGLQGRTITSTAPTLNQVLTWNGVAWTPLDPTGGGGGGISFGGDLSGTSTSQTVIRLQGRNLLSTAPSTHQTISWNGSAWAPLTLAIDDFDVAFVIVTFVAPTIREVGQTIINPGFTASYSSAPTALTLFDSDNATPVSVIGTPNSFNSTHAFVKNTFNAVVTFTLTATKNSVVKTTTSTINWGQKNYWGIGTAGLTTAADIQGLASSAIALTKSTTFQVTAGSTDKIYFAHRTGYGTATFSVGGVVGGFRTVATNISVTNAYSFVENYTLYESDNVNLGTITVTVS